MGLGHRRAALMLAAAAASLSTAASGSTHHSSRSSAPSPVHRAKRLGHPGLLARTAAASARAQPPAASTTAASANAANSPISGNEPSNIHSDTFIATRDNPHPPNSNLWMKVQLWIQPAGRWLANKDISPKN